MYHDPATPLCEPCTWRSGLPAASLPGPYQHRGAILVIPLVFLSITLPSCTPAQVKAVPFLVLVKAVQDAQQSDSEFRARSLGLVLDVCLRLYREGRGIRDELFDAQGRLKYLTDAAQRTLDVVPNTGVHPLWDRRHGQCAG